jgi:hypothetical protein
MFRIPHEPSPPIVSLSYDPYPFGLDAVYLSPPWGGPAYRGDEKRNAREFFDLRRDMEDLDGVHIFEMAKRLTPNIVYFLPKNTSTKQVVELFVLKETQEISQFPLPLADRVGCPRRQSGAGTGLAERQGEGTARLLWEAGGPRGIKCHQTIGWIKGWKK